MARVGSPVTSPAELFGSQSSEAHRDINGPMNNCVSPPQPHVHQLLAILSGGTGEHIEDVYLALPLTTTRIDGVSSVQEIWAHSRTIGQG